MEIKMLEYRQNRLGMAPLKCDNIIPLSENSDSLEFRRILCKGVFDEESLVYVGPQSRSISGVTENGYYLITPRKPIPGNPESVQSPILVNRGMGPMILERQVNRGSRKWWKASKSSILPCSREHKKLLVEVLSKNPNVVKENLPAVAPVEVIGVVHGSEKPSIFVPANDLSTSQWFYVNVPAIARACGLPQNTLYIDNINENIDAGNPYPVPKDSAGLMDLVLTISRRMKLKGMMDSNKLHSNRAHPYQGLHFVYS